MLSEERMVCATFDSGSLNCARCLALDIKPYDYFTARMKRGDEPPPEPTRDQDLLIEIRDLLKAGTASR
jgi:large-conductance mechanosensitive channel